jgi:hypothetical protein
MVSKTFIHAYRIMQKIIENDGHNHWLVDGTPHCNIRRDFIDTKHGIAPRPIINVDIEMCVTFACSTYTGRVKPHPKCSFFLAFF